MRTVDRPRAATPPPPRVAGPRMDRATFHVRDEATPPSTPAEPIPSTLSNDPAESNGFPVIWLDSWIEFTPGLRMGVNASILLDNEGLSQPDLVVHGPARGASPRAGDAPPGRTRVVRISGGYLLDRSTPEGFRPC